MLTFLVILTHIVLTSRQINIHASLIVVRNGQISVATILAGHFLVEKRLNTLHEPILLPIIIYQWLVFGPSKLLRLAPSHLLFKDSRLLVRALARVDGWVAGLDLFLGVRVVYRLTCLTIGWLCITIECLGAGDTV